MRVVCTPGKSLPSSGSDLKFSLFDRSEVEGSGTIALDWPKRLARGGYRPSVEAWDLAIVCLAASAADFNCLRGGSVDGWTRQLDLVITVNQPDKWEPLTPTVERMLRVLTGDIWAVTFLPDGPKPPHAKKQTACDRECVSLLSGGLDSLIGGIDLVAMRLEPLLVSQIVTADRQRQRHYAATLGAGAWHHQWNHSITIKAEHERSTRARSLVFYAQAILAAERILGKPAEVYIPENGFISLNPPLTLGRLGSYSTRTTHPRVTQLLQTLVDALGISAKLKLPYRFMTKGEMLSQCKNQGQLQPLAYDTTSCGRFLRNNRTHCGVCVPCLVRRAAFHAWSPGIDKTRYVYANLKSGAKDNGSDDVQAMAIALANYRREGISAFLGPTLSFASPPERALYEQVVAHGFDEMERFLRYAGIV